MPPDQLAVAIRDLVSQFERHLDEELAWPANGHASRSVPAAELLGREQPVGSARPGFRCPTLTAPESTYLALAQREPQR